MGYKIEKAIYDSNDEKLILVNSEYEIVEEVIVFINYLYSHGNSKNTIDTYLYCIKEFFQFLESESLEFNMVRPLNMQKYVKYLKGCKSDNVNLFIEKKRSPTTINKMLAAVFSLYKYYEDIEKPTQQPNVKTQVTRPSIMYKNFLYHTKKNNCFRYNRNQAVRNLKNHA